MNMDLRKITPWIYSEDLLFSIVEKTNTSINQAQTNPQQVDFEMRK